MIKKEVNIVKKEENVVPYSFEIGKIVRSNCKICSCNCREEIEEWYDKQIRKNYSEIKKRMEQEKELVVSLPAIKNHMIYHHKASERNEQLEEYSRDIQKFMVANKNRVVAIRSRMAIIDRELMSIGAESDDLPLPERRKNAEMITKLVNTQLSCEKELKEYEKNIEPATVILNQLNIIINDEMENLQGTEAKRAFVNVLERLKNSVGNILTEEN